MFWSLRENIGGLKHAASLSARLLLRQDRLKHINILNQRYPDLKLSAATDDHGKPLACRFCGFAIFTCPMEGHQFTACSAVGDNVILHKAKLLEWSKTLPSLENIKLQSAKKLLK